MDRKDIDNLLDRIEQFHAEKLQDVEELRVKLLGKKGEITRLFDEFRTVAPDLKREFGKCLNELKTKAAEKKPDAKSTEKKRASKKSAKK